MSNKLKPPGQQPATRKFVEFEMADLEKLEQTGDDAFTGSKILYVTFSRLDAEIAAKFQSVPGEVEDAYVFAIKPVADKKAKSSFNVCGSAPLLKLIIYQEVDGTLKPCVTKVLGCRGSGSASAAGQKKGVKR